MAEYDLNTTIPQDVKLKSGDIFNCPYTSNITIGATFPKGRYKLEVWGAQGGSIDNTGSYGGGGGYSVGILTLGEDTILHCVPGQQPPTVTTDKSIVPGGYNGGGNGANRYWQETYTYGQGGGGGSDIRIGQNSLYSRVIVAGGGGGSASNGTSQSYELETKGGGGLTGSCAYNGYIGHQTPSSNNGSFGQGANAYSERLNYKYGSGGGGGGWYGGGAVQSADDNDTTLREKNGGGSGYVYTESTASNYPSGCLLNSDYYLTDAATMGIGETFPNYNGNGNTTMGNQGHGACRITVLSLPVPPPIIWFKNSYNIWQKMN